MNNSIMMMLVLFVVTVLSGFSSSGCINGCTGYFDGCNTCGCGTSGVAFCTLIFCPPEAITDAFCRSCDEGLTLNKDQTNNFGCSSVETGAPTESPTIISKPKKKTTKKPRLIKHDVCKKLCSKETKGKPCLHNGLFDRTCFDETDGKCPAGTTKCFDAIPTPKPTTKPSASPTIQLEDIPKETKSPTILISKTTRKPKKSSIVPTRKPPSKKEICLKKCSKITKDLPCIHNAWDNNTCYSYINKKECPSGTTDCKLFKKDTYFKKEKEITLSPTESPTVSPFKSKKSY